MTIPGTTRTAIATHITEHTPATIPLTLDFAGCIIRVTCSTQALHDALAEYFHEFQATQGHTPCIRISAHETTPPAFQLDFAVKTPDPGKTKIKEEWADLPNGRVVRKRLTGMAFIFGNGLNMAVGPCLANSNQVINFINNRFIQHHLSQGGVLGHAAGVRLGKRGIALAGFSGAGKSTLALHLMSQGAQFISNDRVMVRSGQNEVSMFGVAKHPRINPGTALHNPALSGIVGEEKAQRLRTLPPDELWQLEDKYDALIHDCYGPGRFTLHAPMHALFILSWSRDGGPTQVHKVNPQERMDLLPAFMKATGLFYLPQNGAHSADPDSQAYAAVLSQTSVYEISGGTDFEQATNACMAFLRTGDVTSQRGHKASHNHYA